ncbi:hypothetical protein BN1723_013689 [Verticillium longisporum]|uniref:Uncharacterized protein n=1 Tax=Verticillium longisporum TaxID=100787 RepID=A0A0G4LUQ7_VERLO|nr:hypothetical protein BN1723_013689 [Verticillium longisporum]
MPSCPRVIRDRTSLSFACSFTSIAIALAPEPYDSPILALIAGSQAPQTASPTSPRAHAIPSCAAGRNASSVSGNASDSSATRHAPTPAAHQHRSPMRCSSTAQCMTTSSAMGSPPPTAAANPGPARLGNEAQYPGTSPVASSAKHRRLLPLLLLGVEEGRTRGLLAVGVVGGRLVQGVVDGVEAAEGRARRGVAGVDARGQAEEALQGGGGARGKQGVEARGGGGAGLGGLRPEGEDGGHVVRGRAGARRAEDGEVVGCVGGGGDVREPVLLVVRGARADMAVEGRGGRVVVGEGAADVRGCVGLGLGYVDGEVEGREREHDAQDEIMAETLARHDVLHERVLFGVACHDQVGVR